MTGRAPGLFETSTARALRENKRRVTLKTIYQNLDQYWEASLKDHVHSALTTLAATPPPQPQGWNESAPAAPKASVSPGEPSTEIMIRAQSRMLAAQVKAVGPEHPDPVDGCSRLQPILHSGLEPEKRGHYPG